MDGGVALVCRCSDLIRVFEDIWGFHTLLGFEPCVEALFNAPQEYGCLPRQSDAWASVGWYGRRGMVVRDKGLWQYKYRLIYVCRCSL